MPDEPNEDNHEYGCETQRAYGYSCGILEWQTETIQKLETRIRAADKLADAVEEMDEMEIVKALAAYQETARSPAG